MGCKLEDMRDSNINLAIPYLQLFEPAPPPKYKLTEKLTVTIWDRWEVEMSREDHLCDLLEKLEVKYELIPRDIMLGSKPIFFEALMRIPGNEKNLKDTLAIKTLHKLLELEDEKHIDLMITFSKEKKGDILEHVPVVRLLFND